MSLRTVLVMLAFSYCAFAQTWRNPDLELRVKGLHFYTGNSKDEMAPLAACLQTVIGNTDLCCGKGSTLEDSIGQVTPLSLDLTAVKISGRKILPDGRPVIVTTEFTPVRVESNDAPLVSSKIMNALHSNLPLLIQWKSQVYVLYGVQMTETVVQDNTSGGGVFDAIDKLLLFDPASGAKTTFTGGTDNLKDVSGLLTVSVSPSSS